MESMLEKMFDQENVDKAMFHMLEKKNTTDSTGLELYRLPELEVCNIESAGKRNAGGRKWIL